MDVSSWPLLSSHWALSLQQRPMRPSVQASSMPVIGGLMYFCRRSLLVNEPHPHSLQSLFCSRSSCCREQDSM